MAISIICPGCHSRFQVNDKFAGKQGPCPKCKTLINIPKAGEEVKIHAPADFAGTAAKDQSGRPVFKPIARQGTELRPQWAAAVGAGVLVTLGAAWMIGRAAVQEDGTVAVSDFLLGVGAWCSPCPSCWLAIRFFRTTSSSPIGDANCGFARESAPCSMRVCGAFMRFCAPTHRDRRRGRTSLGVRGAAFLSRWRRDRFSHARHGVRQRRAALLVVPRRHRFIARIIGLHPV